MKKFLNHKIIRKKPCKLLSGDNDYSYTDKPLVLLEVTPYHLVLSNNFRHDIYLLRSLWDDGNWILY